MVASCLSMEIDISPREVPQWVLGATLLLMAVLVIAALVIIVVGRWAKRPRQPAGTSSDELAHFRLLYERGECSREEYERIRSRLVPRLRKEIDVPAPSPEPPPPTSESSQNKEPRP